MAPYKDGKVCINRKGEKTWYIFYMADEGEAMPAQVTMKGLVIPAGAKVTVTWLRSAMHLAKRDRLLHHQHTCQHQK
ncbi:MAG: hypothetical protein MZV63_31235 [Marinilabiliales bacterium]|nr:hypothetical protein [Marinilabiliales bacterium]